MRTFKGWKSRFKLCKSTERKLRREEILLYYNNIVQRIKLSKYLCGKFTVIELSGNYYEVAGFRLFRKKNRRYNYKVNFHKNDKCRIIISWAQYEPEYHPVANYLSTLNS